MSGLEQRRTVEALSDVISYQMGLREQKEVIRLMNPAADVSSTDTEFIIGERGVPYARTRQGE